MQEQSVGKGAFYQCWCPEFNSLDPCGRVKNWLLPFELKSPHTHCDAWPQRENSVCLGEYREKMGTMDTEQLSN